MNVHQFIEIYKSLLENNNTIETKLNDIKILFEDYLKQGLLVYYVSRHHSQLSFRSNKDHKRSFTIFYLKRPISSDPNHIPIDKFMFSSYNFETKIYNRTIYIDINLFNSKYREIYPIEVTY